MNLSPKLNECIANAIAELRQAGAPDDANTLEYAYSRLTDPNVNVAIVGEFNAGKSTFVNALIGRELVKTGLRPMTNVATHIKKGSEDKVTALVKDGTSWEFGLADLEHLGVVKDEISDSPEIVRLEITLTACNLPDNLVLIDTPGLNDNEERSASAKQAAALADMVLLMVNARQLGTKEERQLIDNLPSALPRCVVVNHMNLLPSGSDREAIRAMLNQWLGNGGANESTSHESDQWLEFSAIDALRKAIGLPHVEAELTDYSRLSKMFAGLPHSCLKNRTQALLIVIDASLKRSTKNLDPFVRIQQAEHQNRQSLAAKAHTSVKRLEQLRSHHLKEIAEMADRSWAECLSRIKTRITNQSQEKLAAYAEHWFDAEVDSCVEAINRFANARLAAIAQEESCNPARFHLVRPVLNGRIKPQIPEKASSVPATIIGGAMGAPLGPLGMLAGAAVMKFLVGLPDSSAPHVSSYFVAAAERNWNWSKELYLVDFPDESWDAYEKIIAEAKKRTTVNVPPLEAHGASLSKACNALRALQLEVSKAFQV